MKIWNVAIVLEVLAAAVVAVAFSSGVNAQTQTVRALHQKLRAEMTAPVLVVTVGSLSRVPAATNHVVVNHNADAKHIFVSSPHFGGRECVGSIESTTESKERDKYKKRPNK